MDPAFADDALMVMGGSNTDVRMPKAGAPLHASTWVWGMLSRKFF